MNNDNVVKPSLKSGAMQTWVKGSGKELTFVSDAEFDTFKTVLIDGKELVRDVDYTAVAGSTKITVKPAALDKLSVGKHTLEIKSTTGSVKTTFNVVNVVKKAESPKTADSSNLMAFTAVIIMGAAVLAFVSRKKLNK